jgi:hypothetical protein
MRALGHLIRIFLLFGILVIFKAHAETAADPKECTIQDSSGAVIVLVCPPGLTQKEWQLAGQDACASINGICNVWIWDDYSKAPKKAPITDTDLNKEQVRNAIAVWANDVQRLMVLRQAR